MLDYILIALVPVLMIADHILAGIEYRASKQTYGKHIQLKTDTYYQLLEKKLNARFPIPISRLAAISFITACAIFIFIMDTDRTVLYLLLGYSLGSNLISVMTRVAHILFYRFVDSHPEEINGTAELSSQLLITIQMYRMLIPITLLGLIILVNPTPFTIGCLAGALVLVIKHIFLMKSPTS